MCVCHRAACTLVREGTGPHVLQGIARPGIQDVIYYIAQRRDVKNRRDDTGTDGGVPIHRGAFQREN